MPPTANTGPNPKDRPDLGAETEPIEGPPEEEFWDRYNKKLEFPLATVAAVFLHVIVGAVLVYILVGLMDNGEDRSNPPQQLVSVDGYDDAGEGSAGGGGESTDLVQRIDPFLGGKDGPVAPDSLPDAKDNLPKVSIPDVPGALPLPTPSGGVAGSGRPAPKGAGSGGTGPGGTGADSTAARGHRWVLKFTYRDSRDYIAQLHAMEAEIVVPFPSDEKSGILVRDLSKPDVQSVVTEADRKRHLGMLRMGNRIQSHVEDVVKTLGVKVPGRPTVFWAHFSKDMEEKMARLETSFRGRRPENIEETTFVVSFRGGKYEIVVDKQSAK